MASPDELETLGLTRHEAAVYRALLGFDRAPAAALAAPAGIDRTHVYAALKRLQARGLVTSTRGRVKTFSAVAPDRAFKQALEGRHRQLDASRRAVAEMARRFRARRPAGSKPAAIEVIASSNPAAFADVRRRIRRARREVLSVLGSRQGPVSRARSRKSDELELAALRRGVTARCVYAREAVEDEFGRSRLVASVRAGEQARVADEVPFHILVVDDDLAVFVLPDGDGRYSVYRLNDPKLVMVFRLAFEQLWAGAADPGPWLEDS